MGLKRPVDRTRDKQAQNKCVMVIGGGKPNRPGSRDPLSTGSDISNRRCRERKIFLAKRTPRCSLAEPTPTTIVPFRALSRPQLLSTVSRVRSIWSGRRLPNLQWRKNCLSLRAGVARTGIQVGHRCMQITMPAQCSVHKLPELKGFSLFSLRCCNRTYRV